MTDRDRELLDQILEQLKRHTCPLVPGCAHKPYPLLNRWRCEMEFADWGEYRQEQPGEVYLGWPSGRVLINTTDSPTVRKYTIVKFVNETGDETGVRGIGPSLPLEASPV